MKRLTLTSVFALLFTGLSILSLRGAEPELDLAPARWIWYPSQRTLSNTMLMLRKEFTLDSVPEKVSGWILADSRYRLWINGQRVQWGPAPADPRWPEADPLDIRPYLQKGKNVLAAEVLYFGLGDGTSPIGKPGFICKLEVGNRLVASDSTWLVSVARSWPAGQYKRHYVRAFQEEFDANRYPDGWRQADYTPGSEWVYAMELGGRADRSQLATDYPEYLQDYWASNRDVSRIRPRSIPLMREYRVPVSKLAESMWLTWDQDPRTYFEMNTPHSYRADRTPCAVQENDSTWSVVASDGRAAVLTFELGEQVVGFPAFTIDAPAGTVVELLTHEAHEVGGPELLNTHFNAWSRWTCREGRNRFEAFDFESARWLQRHIRNFTGKVTVSGVGLRRRIFPWPHDPAIRIGDPAIQRVMDATVNTLNNSAQDLIVDGMGRERQQYSGDCGHQLHAVMGTFGETRLPRRFLITYSQGLSSEGYFLDCWPAYDRLARVMQKQLGLSNWGPLLDHGVGFVFDNYYYYCQTGDTTHLAETLPRLLRSFDYLTTLMNPADSLLPVENLGIPSVWIDHHGYKKSRHKILAFNLYVSAMCQYALAPLCELTGRTADAVRARAFGEALQQACVRRFWSPERQVFVCNLPWEREEGETRYHDRDLATAVLFDMCPGGKTARSVELLAEEPAEMGFSYPANAVWRLWALIKANRIDVVLNDLRTRWAGMESVSLNNTLQEGWHAKPDNREQWSHCPIAPLIVLQQGIAGIRPLEPGYGRFEIAPQPGDLTDAAFTVQTVKGPIDFAVSGKRGNRRLSFTVPAGTTAELVLPAGEKVPFPPVASEGGDGLQNGLQDGVGRGLSDLLHDGQSGACRYRIDGGRKVELRLRHL